MEKLTGLIAAPFTPMDDRGELALNQVEALAALYRHNRISGAFIAGSTGEGVSLSFEEKRELMRAWAEVKTDQLKLVFMLGGTSLKEMQHLAREAIECQMDAVSVLCPFYFRPRSVEALVDFCALIADAAPDLPFYYYNIPSLTGGHYSMLRFLELADKRIPNLAGIKFTHTNIMEYQLCRTYRNGKYDLLWGIDEALLSGLAAGTKGAVGSTYNYAAPLYHQIIAAYADRDLEKADHYQLLSVRMVELLEKYGGAGAGKAFMKLIGVDCGWFRPPVSRPTPAEVRELEKELQALGFFEFCSKQEANRASTH